MNIIKITRKFSVPGSLIISVMLLQFIAPKQAVSQFYFDAGINGCYIRDNNLLEGERPAVRFTSGFSVRLPVFKEENRWALESGLRLDFKGYKQELGVSYNFIFTYLTAPIAFSFEVSKKFRIGAGSDFSKLISTNVRQGLKTYNHADVGLATDLWYVADNSVLLQLHFSYGITPVLDYYSFDNLGNITGEIHGLKNTVLSFRILIPIPNTHAKKNL